MFFVTILLAVLGLVGTDLYVPSLPQISIMYHQPVHITQLTITLFLSGFCISQLFYGPLSDYFGRKPPLITGVIIFIAGSIICIFANSFALLCIGRIIQGIGVGSGLSLARVIIRDCYTGKMLAVRSAQIGIFVSLTPPVAPLIGGVLQEYFGIKASFVFMLVYGLILLVLLFCIFPETIKEKSQELNVKHILLHYIKFIKNATFIRYALIAGLGFASIILYASVLPFIIQTQLKLSASINGIILLLSALGISCGSFFSSRAVSSVSSQKLVKLGLILFLVGGSLLLITEILFGTQLVYLIPCIFIISFACGTIFPNAIVVCFSEVHVNIGIAGALYGTIQMCTATLINFILNGIAHQGQGMLGIFYLAIGVTGLLLYRVSDPSP